MCNFVFSKNKYTEMSKKERLSTILSLVRNHSINSQEDLLILLKKQGFDITQATLSRDMRELKIIKFPDEDGTQKYIVLNDTLMDINNEPIVAEESIGRGFLSLEFSDKLAVIKTRPGYAMAIASDIDNQVSHAILGTIAGDDTLLLIPREGISREEIINALTLVIPRPLLVNK